MWSGKHFKRSCYLYDASDFAGKSKEAEEVYKQAVLEASRSKEKFLQSQVASMVQFFPKKKS